MAPNPSLKDRIYRDAKATGLPVELPTTVELVVNLKSARALGITIAHLEVPITYRIALHESEQGYSVSVPGLPGCR